MKIGDEEDETEDKQCSIGDEGEGETEVNLDDEKWQTEDEWEI